MSDGGKYFTSTGAGSIKKPAVVSPDGEIVAIASTPANAEIIAIAMNAQTKAAT